MTCVYVTSRQTLKDAVGKAMDALEKVGHAANMLSSAEDKAEVLAEVGNGYARVAQAVPESLDEVQ